MTPTALSTTYLASGLLFVLSLGGFAKQETAPRGNLFGMVGMVRGSEDLQRSNALMRWRVTLQAVTLLLFALLLYMMRG